MWITRVLGLPYSIITHLSVKLGEGGITCTIHASPWWEWALRGWGHRLPLAGAVTSTRELPSKSTAILRGWAYGAKTKLNVHSSSERKFFAVSIIIFFKRCPFILYYKAPLQELTCAKATAGTHGAARFRSGLAYRWDADRATQYSPALLRTHILHRTFGDQKVLIYIHLLFMSKTNIKAVQMSKMSVCICMFTFSFCSSPIQQ